MDHYSMEYGNNYGGHVAQDYYGREFQDNSDGPSYGIGHHSPASGYYDEYDDDIDNLLNEIANSSPSPPERTYGPRPHAVASPYQRTPQQSAVDTTHRRFAQDQEGPDRMGYEMIPRASHSSLASTSRGPARSIPLDGTQDMSSYTTINNFMRRPEYEDSSPQGTRNWHGTRLRPVSDLPDIYRSLFKFGVFNAVQSQCYDAVMNTDENMVISAPTGSGKTVLFELAIVKMLKQSASSGERTKCVYIAPTKSLCTEKASSWENKFTPFGAKCSELTGDTVHSGRGAWGDAKDATIIVTTGEKWDSLTRNWQDHSHILSQIQLFLIDEVHLLNESRGSTLEVVVSRMKLRGAGVRFLVVSATVPNIADVADWVGSRVNSGPAMVKEFGEEYRPCKLSRFVYGVVRRRDANDFVFAKALDYKLYGILQQHCNNKPVLVFCPTRKGVMAAAEHILKEYEEAMTKKEVLPWSKPPHIQHSFSNRQLDKLAVCGIGVHHAGLSREDRSATEKLYLQKTLKVLFATSTLAVGVNLPAHTVIIKGVKLFQNNSSQEYSDLDVMQMIGRAGRPQFDKEGVAVIMCEQELEAKYKALAQGQTVLESSLHLHLPEHLNSEIALGTITNMASAKEWLHNSFLYRRLRKNPSHYDARKEGNKSWEERMDDMVAESVKTLKEADLVSLEGADDALSSTEYGDIMSKFYIRQATMIIILKLSGSASVREILEALSCAEEFAEIKFRAGEKQVYNKLRTHHDIRYTMMKIEKPSDKVFLLIQAILGAINLSDPEYKTGETQPYTESIPILRHISRIARAVVEVAVMREAGLLVKNALEVLRCLNAKAWEDRSVVFRQLDDIGLKSLKVLAEHKVTTFAALRKMDPTHIENLLNRKPPFGQELLATIHQLPQYTLSITESDISAENDGVEVTLSMECGLIRDTKGSKAKKTKKQKRWDMTLVLTLTSDNTFVDFRRISTAALREPRTFGVSVKLTKPSQSVLVYVASDVYAGLTVTKTYKPKVESSMFPVMDTRPQDALARDLEGLEDMPDFWNMSDEEVDAIGADPKPSHRVATPPAHQESELQKPPQKPPTSSAVSTITAAPRHLANGNYECNHTCKDKTKCRHLCCRDGLEKPPPMTKKRIEALIAGDNGPAPSHASSQRKTTTRNDGEPKHKGTSKSLQRLEALHERTGVEKNLRLEEGGRIKLQSELSSQSQPSRKPVPQFDVEFTRLKHEPSAAATTPMELSDSDEDLPDPGSYLRMHSKSRPTEQPDSSASTSYSNSEFDALIANAPVSEADPYLDARGNSRSTGVAYSSPYRMDVDAISPPRKRKQTEHDKSLQQKRIKRVLKDTSELKGSSSPILSGRRQEVLFDLSPADEDILLSRRPGRSSPATSPGLDYDEGFTLDTSLFEIMPSTPPLTDLVDAERAEMYPTNPAIVDALRNREPVKKEDPYKLSSAQPEAEEHDPLAELEAWLQSGAVEIGEE
ncbi:P-loop containing nucleoside triphosphate hydrolase protein [Cubamyces sp. BRFM 1775]|nr:P-loop containing nucleoside triphosphate hydrolase protein [Cubamyces sp. BRFM 1775]